MNKSRDLPTLDKTSMFYSEGVTSHSPGLPSLAATLGKKTPWCSTLKGLRLDGCQNVKIQGSGSREPRAPENPSRRYAIGVNSPLRETFPK
jgi:hypothetical protein